jgi:hypothetical protein
MIFPRLIPLAMCWFVAGAGSAAAESCSPAAIVGAYQQAEAAYQAKDLTAAAAQFQPLAEQGLGPAQLRLGEILMAADKPDLMQAYRWIALAADVHAPGAAATLTKLTEKIGPGQVALEHFTPSTWRPAQVWSCLAGNPGLAPPPPAKASLDWLGTALETIRTKNSRYLIYLKALNVGFTNGAGPFVIPSERDKLPFILLNESYLGKVSAKEPGALQNAVITAVHAVLVPQAFVDANVAVTETYKGYTIRTINGHNGEAFLHFAKAAIDMSDQLPPDLLKLARAMTDIRYEPPMAGGGSSSGAGALAFGTFKRDAKSGQGYMSFVSNTRGRGPAWMVVALVDGGVFLRRGGTGHAGGADAAHGDCEMDAIEIRTMEALKISPFDVGHAKEGSARRGCPRI